MNIDWETSGIIITICCSIALLILLIISYRLHQIILISTDDPVASIRRPCFTMFYLKGSILSAVIGTIIVVVSGHIRSQFALWVASRCTLYIGHFTLMALRMWVLLYDLHQTRTDENQHVASRLHLKGEFDLTPYTPHQLSPRQLDVRSLWMIIAWNLCLFALPLATGPNMITNVEWHVWSFRFRMPFLGVLGSRLSFYKE